MRFVDGMSNEDYHDPENGLSTSTLKQFLVDPASVVWSRNAPRDNTKMDAINFGTDFHSYFLEPEEFKKQYKVLPTFNRRKKEEKEEEQQLIKLWQDDGITAVKREDMIKLEAMRQSCMAHPTVKEIMLLNSVSERSFFWADKRTGIDCKCRPDYLAENISDATRPQFMPSHFDTLIMDIKTTGDIDNIQKSVENFGYYIQDPFYTEGVSLVTGGTVCFVFVFVSTTLSMGRYPVKAVVLSEAAKLDGYNAMTEALQAYANTTQWATVLEIDRPYWATRQEEYL